MTAFPTLSDKQAIEEGAVLAPKFDRNGLVTCIATDAKTGELLMVAHMNAESLKRSIETGEAWYWSRSRGELWHKGATSGNTQRLVDFRLDCDGDTLLCLVEAAGPACHTGEVSCFYRRHASDASER